MNIVDIFFIVFIQLLVLSAINHFSKISGIKNRQPLYYLWFYHMVFCLIFWYYINQNGGDALGYWKMQPGGIGQYLSQGPGTNFIYVLNYVFVIVLHLSFFTGSVIYASVGFLGFLFFYLSLVVTIETNVKVFGINYFPIILFLPNLHFWSSGVGKDTLVFFAIGLFTYSTLRYISRLPGIIISLVLIYFIRPHITIFLLLSFGIGFLFDNRLKLSSKIILSLGMLAGAAFIFSYVLQFLKLDELSSENIRTFSTTRVTNLSRETTGSSVDLLSYPLIAKIFTFIYRPLFFDAKSITALFASIENFIILLLTFRLFTVNPLKAFSKAPFPIKGIFLFFLIGTISFSNILGNLGIMMRMKNMLMPGFLSFLLWALSYEKAIKIRKTIRIKKLIVE